MVASRKTQAADRIEGDDDAGWHLARSAEESRLADLEFALERVAQAYYRWKAACFIRVAEMPISGDDVAVLNMVRFGERPKRLSEIAQLLNRTDIPNLQYAMRKFVKAALVEPVGSGSRRDTRYRVTAAGTEVTDAYAALRREILVPLARDLDPDGTAFEDVPASLDRLAAIYGNAAQIAPTK